MPIVRRLAIFAYDDEEDDAEKEKYAHLPDSSHIEQLKPQLAKVGQKVYDAWVVNEDGYDTRAGYGGVCNLIAHKMVDLLRSHKIPCSLVSAWDEIHTSVVAQCRDGIFSVDIPWRLYERVDGYDWIKLPNIKFTPNFVTIHKIDSDPARMARYVEEWEDDR